jgi:hypothetical protein
MPRPALLAVAAAAALAAPATSWADAGHRDGSAAGKTAAQHDMTADEHAHMSADEHGMTPDEHAGMTSDDHGMSADEHAHMGAHEQAATADDAPAGHGDAAAGHGTEHGGGHGAAATTKDRPVALVLGGFGLLNALVLAYAAVIRRRPDARKRRQRLERVRTTPPEQTVFPSSSSPSSQP